METLTVSEDSTRAEIERAIKSLRAKAKRLPAHWVDDLEAIGRDVTRWSAGGSGLSTDG